MMNWPVARPIALPPAPPRYVMPGSHWLDPPYAQIPIWPPQFQGRWPFPRHPWPFESDTRAPGTGLLMGPVRCCTAPPPPPPWGFPCPPPLSVLPSPSPPMRRFLSAGGSPTQVSPFSSQPVVASPPLAPAQRSIQTAPQPPTPPVRSPQALRSLPPARPSSPLPSRRQLPA